MWDCGFVIKLMVVFEYKFYIVVVDWMNLFLLFNVVNVCLAIK